MLVNHRGRKADLTYITGEVMCADCDALADVLLLGYVHVEKGDGVDWR